MGTSASSKGPASGVPLVPAWIGNNPAVAEPARFRSARTNLGSFAKGGSQDSLKRGLGHYSRSGLGGSAAGTARMGRSTAAAGGFADVLSALRDGSPIPQDIALDPATLAGKGQQEIADAIIDAVTPTNGTQDAESSRDSAARAFAEVLEINPAANFAGPKYRDFDDVKSAAVAVRTLNSAGITGWVGGALNSVPLAERPNLAAVAERGLREIERFLSVKAAL